MITAGLGLSSPQLALMLTAGYLVLIDATAGAPPDPNEVITAPPAALEQTLADLATRLGLPAPVSDDARHPATRSIRGEATQREVMPRARRGDIVEGRG